MNKTKIEWTDYTWNPITGCTKGCSYCYARAISKRFNRSFEPTFHLERLFEPQKVKKPSKIFVCSMGEFFDRKVKWLWQEQVLTMINSTPQHTYQLLTKVPENINGGMEFPPNLWLGVSCTGVSDTLRFKTLLDVDCSLKFISFEPLLNDPAIYYLHGKPDWVIVGGQTGRKKIIPNKKWVEDIIKYCEIEGVPLFIKDNVEYPRKIQQFPEVKLRDDGR